MVDIVFGLGIFAFALTQHTLPRVPELPSIPAFEWSWAASNPTLTAILATALLLAGMLAARRVKVAGKAFAERVRQGFTILRTPRRYFLLVAIPQIAGWGCRVASAAAFLEAFAIPGTLRNALLVMVVGSLTTLLPVTPGGVGHPAGADRRRAQRRGERRPAALVLGRHAGRRGGLQRAAGRTRPRADAAGTFSLRSAIGHARHHQRADGAPP